MPPKKTLKAIKAEEKKKNTAQAEDIVAKLKREMTKSTRHPTDKPKKDMVPTTNETSVPMETNFDSSEAGGVSTIDHSRATKHAKSPSTSQRTKSAESSASSSKVSKTSVSARKATKSGNSKIGDYQYEIDCEKVADSIDVADLKQHLEKHLKVNGKKNNLDGTISIQCKEKKVVIKSNTYLPKKSLRFLSKKFLKKNWNIRVVSKNVHSYEYKYVGSL